MLKTTSKGLAVLTAQTTRKVLDFVGRSYGRMREPENHRSHQALSSHMAHASGSDPLTLNDHEIRAIFEFSTFEDRLLSNLILHAKPLHFTPLQLLLLLIACSSSLKNYFEGREDTQEDGYIAALKELLGEEMEHIYQLTSARNALVSPDPR